MAFKNDAIGGESGELVRAAIHSPNYVPGVSGWTINRDGYAEFNNVNIRLDLAAGTITVGEVGGPQVVIRVSTAGAGIIEFPTGNPIESESPRIGSDSTTDQIFLHLFSGYTDGNPSDSTSELTLMSGDVNTGDNPTAFLSAYGNVGYSEVQVADDNIYLQTDLVYTSSELFVNDVSSSGNYPGRVVRGKTETASSSTPISKVSDTAIVDASITGTTLENGIAYRVDVQIRTNATVGTSAVGTQLIFWKLWDGLVGSGTQLGSTIQKCTESVGTVSSSQNFYFIFHHTGTTGTRTLRLSAIHAIGADTLQATVSSQYFMIVNRIGRPSNILEL